MFNPFSKRKKRIVKDDPVSKSTSTLFPLPVVAASSSRSATLPLMPPSHIVVGKDLEIVEVKRVRDQGLDVLNLSFRGMEGELVADVYELGPQMRKLLAAGNQLTTLRPEIAQLSGLELLNLGSNSIVQFPEGICMLSNLTNLTLNNNQLTSLPSSISNLRHLKELHLSNNPLAQIPPELSAVETLEVLKLSKCSLSSLPHELRALRNLKELCLSENNFSGHIPLFIFSLRSLEILMFNKNSLTSLLPAPQPDPKDHQADQSNPDNNVDKTTSSSNDDEIAQSLPSKLADSIDVADDSGGGGSQMHPWAGLGALKTLILNDNTLADVPPHTIGLCTSLDMLNLCYNCIASLPDDLGALKRLATLDLSTNLIETIPEALAGMDSLAHLDVSYNNIHSLPDSLMSMKALAHLSVLGNCLRDDSPALEQLVIRLKAQGVAVSANGRMNLPDLIMPNLYLGGVYSAKDKWALKQLGVTHVLTLAENIPPFHPHHFAYKVVLVDDNEGVDLLEHFQGCKDFIDAGRQNGAVLVHCAAGISRSASVVIMYVMLEMSLGADEALEYVKARRGIICPNNGFRRQIVRLEQEIKEQVAGDNAKQCTVM